MNYLFCVNVLRVHTDMIFWIGVTPIRFAIHIIYMVNHTVASDSIDMYTTPAGDIPVKYDDNNNAVAPVHDLLDVYSDTYDVYNSDDISTDAIATKYLSSKLAVDIDHVVQIDANTVDFDKMLTMMNRKTSQYGGSSWEQARDGDKSDDEIKGNHNVGYFAEYAFSVLAIRNDWNVKQVQEIKDDSDTNQYDFITPNGDKIDMKAVRTSSNGVNHPWVKWVGGLDKNKYHNKVESKVADFGIHAYVAFIQDNDDVSQQLVDGDIEITDIDDIVVMFDTLADYSVLKTVIDKYNMAATDKNLHKFVGWDNIVYIKRDKIYDYDANRKFRELEEW